MKSLLYKNKLTLLVMWSSQAILILAEVAGEFQLNHPLNPASFRAAFTASLIAKNIEYAKNKGGSPTACKNY